MRKKLFATILSVAVAVSMVLPFSVSAASAMSATAKAGDAVVDGTVSEGNNYYFAVYKNKKKYASVKVNMQTGDAVETRTKDGATANFNVFV